MPYVADALPVAVPEILDVGEPGFGYPERWSVVRWLDGEVADVPADGARPRHALARDLAAVVTALRDLAVPDAAAADPALRWYRGEPVARMDAATRAAIADSRSIAGLDLDLDACADVWERAMRVPGVADLVEPRWHHADLLAENLLVHDGRLAGVLDFGGLAVGDPTVDLVVAWELLDPAARETFRDSGRRRRGDLAPWPGLGARAGADDVPVLLVDHAPPLRPAARDDEGRPRRRP